MKHEVFSVHDAKAEAYLPPFYCVNALVAIRTFSTAAMDAGHQFHMNPSDYTLFHLGSWDDMTALFTLFPTAAPLGKAIEFVGTRDVLHETK